MKRLTHSTIFAAGRGHCRWRLPRKSEHPLRLITPFEKPDHRRFPSAPVEKGDLVVLGGGSVLPGVTRLSATWANSGSNGTLKAPDNVLLYAPSDASVQNATACCAIAHVFRCGNAARGWIYWPNQDKHILVAYDASSLGSINHVAPIADVDLANTGISNQSSTANLHVFALDMVSLVGVSLASLAAANIQFI